MEIRLAGSADLEAIVGIYNHYVLHSTATFDEAPVSVAGRADWLETFAPTGRYRLVVADDGGVVGYACSIPYRKHPAFAVTAELSVYIAPDRVGEGVGTALYERLFAELAPEDLHRAVAGIALPNDPSVRLHQRFGFTEVGTFDEYATKWGRQLSSVWMQRPL